MPLPLSAFVQVCIISACAGYSARLLEIRDAAVAGSLASQRLVAAAPADVACRLPAVNAACLSSPPKRSGGLTSVVCLMGGSALGERQRDSLTWTPPRYGVRVIHACLLQADSTCE